MSTMLLSPFNLSAALKGSSVIHRFDIGRANAQDFASRTLRFIDDPNHPAYLVYCGEWLVYDATEDGIASMERDLLMVQEVQ